MAAFVALVAPASALPGLSPAGTGRGERVAFALWGPPKCGNGPSALPLVWSYKLPELVYAFSDGANCRIEFGGWLRRKHDPALRNAAFVCTLIVHEWGHLTGHYHSTDPNNVMFPVPHTYGPCR